jgi:uncharacterized protein
MSRLLFWLALAVLVVFAIRSKLRSSGMKGPGARRSNHLPREGASEPMACCAHCGVYFPASEAVHADGRDYCCPAHVRLPSK